MRSRRLRAELEQLKSLARRVIAAQAPSYGFKIDPALAKALQDDQHRIDELDLKRIKTNKPLRAEEVQEQVMLRARIAERASTIACPASYGAIEAGKDSNRLGQLHNKRMYSWDGGHVTNREDAEEARLIARTAAFDQSPEGRGRSRIRELVFDSFTRKGLSPAEQNELDSLQARYPELPLDADDPRNEIYEAFDQALREFK
jgi:hypothetical protein